MPTSSADAPAWSRSGREGAERRRATGRQPAVMPRTAPLTLRAAARYVDIDQAHEDAAITAEADLLAKNIDQPDEEAA